MFFPLMSFNLSHCRTVYCFSNQSYNDNKTARKSREFCGGRHCFRYCSWPLVQQKSPLLIGLNCILYLNDNSMPNWPKLCVWIAWIVWIVDRGSHFSSSQQKCQIPGRGHFHSKVIGMLVVFLGYKIMILLFLGSSGKCLENRSHFSQNSPKNCNLGIFRGLKSKSGYFLGFSKKISNEHTYHFYIKSAPPPLCQISEFFQIIVNTFIY